MFCPDPCDRTHARSTLIPPPVERAAFLVDSGNLASFLRGKDTVVTDSLLAQVAAGDDGAVAACVDVYSSLVWSLARRFTSNRAEAEDAVQEIFIDLWSSAGRFDSSKASETTFIAMVARRRLIDRLRKTSREPPMDDIDAAFDLGTPGPAAATEVKDEAARAARLIKTLTPEQQQIIQLSVYQGHTHRSIADSLGIPLGTVKTHLRRGLLRIRNAMQAPSGGAKGKEVVP